jgi:hypothetical protein
LPVHISRDQLHSLEVPATFEADGSFDIRLINHAESLHVHLHLDDPLSEIAKLDAGNHYVEGETERRVRVEVDTDALGERPTFGKIKVATAYGAETRWIDVELTEPDDTPNSIEIDESLSNPQPKEQSREPLFDSQQLPVLVLGVVALLIAVLSAVLFQETAITAGAVLLFAGVVTALFFLSKTDR